MSVDIVATRAANALLADVEARIPSVPYRQQVDGTLGRFKTSHGGLWVGGRATLTRESLSFRPNSVNRGLHTGALDFEIPLGDIVSVEVRPAFVSSVIAMGTPRSDVKIRCFRADAFAQQIAQLAGVGLSRAAGGWWRIRLSGD